MQLLAALDPATITVLVFALLVLARHWPTGPMTINARDINVHQEIRLKIK